MNEVSPLIDLLDGPTQTRIRPEDVYFTFSSGRFGYDCVSCNSKCCRGHGFLLSQGPELAAHIAERPALTWFLDKPDPRTQTCLVSNLTPSCFFLSEGGLCQVQQQKGYDAKPETCRLFPFNSIRRIGKTLIVAPHSGLCPLQIIPAGHQSDMSDHAQLLRGMAAQGVRASVSDVYVEDADHSGVLRRERTILELSETLLDSSSYADFALRQLAISRGIEPTSVPSALDDELRAFTSQVTNILGESPSASSMSSPVLRAAMFACTPVLRGHLVFRSGKPSQGIDVPFARIPHFLVAQNILLALAMDAGMKNVTYQTVMQVFNGCRPLLTMLALADCEVRWHRGATIAWPLKHDPRFEAAYLQIVKALLSTKGNASPCLSDIVANHAPATFPDRVIFLKQVAKNLSGRLVPVSRRDDPAPRKRFLRRKFQRLTLQHCGSGLLETVATRRSSTAPLAPEMERDERQAEN